MQLQEGNDGRLGSRYGADQAGGLPLVGPGAGVQQLNQAARLPTLGGHNKRSLSQERAGAVALGQQRGAADVLTENVYQDVSVQATRRPQGLSLPFAHTLLPQSSQQLGKQAAKAGAGHLNKQVS